jgi:ubiquinone/menaquinone biosynthesis C-methylase UbiE
MVANAGWSATVDLRAWEREHLRLTGGERMLDVGCGLGDAARELANDLGPTGEVIGLDASTTMLHAAQLSWDAACPAHFTTGDAQALDLPTASVDAARSERLLQWLPDPRRPSPRWRGYCDRVDGSPLSIRIGGH